MRYFFFGHGKIKTEHILHSVHTNSAAIKSNSKLPKNPRNRSNLVKYTFLNSF